MSIQFRRLPKLKEELKINQKLEGIEKQERRQILAALQRLLELNTTSKATRGVLYQVAKFISTEGLNPYDLVDEWLRVKPEHRVLHAAQRPKEFYRYVKFERLSREDTIVRVVYLEVVKLFVRSRLSIPDRAFKGLDFVNKLNRWVGGKQVGNRVEDILTDFLVVVFTEVQKFNKSLLLKPRTILGDFGWRTFTAWVEEHYGGVNGYVLPTNVEYKAVKEQRDRFIEVARVRYKALQEGDVQAFDALGRELWTS